MAAYNLGKVAMTPKGTYSSTTTYNQLDVVLYQGSSYVCKSDNITNKIPTNTTYWQQLAAAGQATMTEQQKQEIIDGILAQGVIVDPNYNTFTSEEKTKLAGLEAPNNGTLTIKMNNMTIGTFTADSSVNKTVNIPVPTNYLRSYEIEIIDDSNPYIEAVKNGHIYYIPGCYGLTIDGIEAGGGIDAVIDEYTFNSSYIFFLAKGDFKINIPKRFLSLNPIERYSVNADEWYRIKVENGIFSISHIYIVE